MVQPDLLTKPWIQCKTTVEVHDAIFPGHALGPILASFVAKKLWNTKNARYRYNSFFIMLRCRIFPEPLCETQDNKHLSYCDQNTQTFCLRGNLFKCQVFRLLVTLFASLAPPIWAGWLFESEISDIIQIWHPCVVYSRNNSPERGLSPSGDNPLGG